VYCRREDLSEYLLLAYQAKAEEIAPGIVDRCVAAANGRVEDALRATFVLPLATVPDTLRQIAAALAAHGVVGAITTLLNEAEFMFLLDQVREARKALARIVEGKDDIGLERLGAEPVADAGVEVHAPQALFGPDTWERF